MREERKRSHIRAPLSADRGVHCVLGLFGLQCIGEEGVQPVHQLVEHRMIVEHEDVVLAVDDIQLLFAAQQLIDVHGAG